MWNGASRRRVVALATLSWLAVVPGTATAQPLDPSTVVETSPLGRALLSAAAVGLVGSGYLTWSRALVDRAVDDTMARPGVAVAYGLLAFLLVLFVSLYANDLLARVGVAGTPLGLIAVAILASGMLAVGGLGYVVVGTLLTDLYGVRQPWQGLALGAVLSAVGWLALPLAGAFVLWVLLAAVGVGGRTRTWVHSERTVASELDP